MKVVPEMALTAWRHVEKQLSSLKMRRGFPQKSVPSENMTAVSYQALAWTVNARSGQWMNEM